MHTINVLYFASIREAMGVGNERLQTSATTVSQLRDEIIRSKGEIAANALAANKAVRVAVNQLMSKGGDAAIQDGDEVAFFPPVTGG